MPREPCLKKHQSGCAGSHLGHIFPSHIITLFLLTSSISSSPDAFHLSMVQRCTYSCILTVNLVHSFLCLGRSWSPECPAFAFYRFLLLSMPCRFIFANKCRVSECEGPWGWAHTEPTPCIELWSDGGFKIIPVAAKTNKMLETDLFFFYYVLKLHLKFYFCFIHPKHIIPDGLVHIHLVRLVPPSYFMHPWLHEGYIPP